MPRARDGSSRLQRGAPRASATSSTSSRDQLGTLRPLRARVTRSAPAVSTRSPDTTVPSRSTSVPPSSVPAASAGSTAPASGAVAATHTSVSPAPKTTRPPRGTARVLASRSTLHSRRPLSTSKAWAPTSARPPATVGGTARATSSGCSRAPARRVYSLPSTRGFQARSRASSPSATKPSQPPLQGATGLRSSELAGSSPRPTESPDRSGRSMAKRTLPSTSDRYAP